ncbi:MAG: ribulose-phosphate 3-epimerase [Chloroflexi bacterium]|nr:ribulose-phosphate 3-epimerase [Chloroflexota bacterium]
MAARVRLAPSLLNADFGRLAAEIQAAEAGGADWIHVDVMDGTFVPNITLGPMVVQAIRRATSLPLDVHLMVAEPRRYVGSFVDAGANVLTIHLEADRHPHRTLSEIRARGSQAGLALNPGSPVALAEDLVEDLDLLLVMSVNPGFGGQAFIPRALRKLRQARALIDAINPACALEVDGGIKLHNARAATDAGADVLVAGSFVYQGGEGPAANLVALRQTLA